ncbi:MAG: hypothetical protein KatS3mg015_1399 [Fimbriimonadales bacterium]|nr:MAG: hypothetical protein KatS3mg015_1399 [Fimbriimonadales bacterium]
MRSRAFLRLNLIGILGLVGLVILLAIGFVVLMNRQTPEAAVQKFMEGLANQDLQTLNEYSYLEKPSKPIEEQWRYCFDVASKGMPFVWRIGDARMTGDGHAVVDVYLVQFSIGGAKEVDEPFKIPVIQKDGRWKVDLVGVPRDFFPGLPR